MSREGRAPEDCRTARVVVIVGTRTDKSLRAGETWARERARAVGGEVYLWRSYSNSTLLDRMSVSSITEGGITPIGRYEAAPRGNESGFDELLPEFSDCQGRIEELVVFHHGSPVDEAEVADQLLGIFRGIRVPVCRLVWWACDAEVALEMGEGEWGDLFMKNMGSIARCRPCGCQSPIELVWPTEGKCGVKVPPDEVEILTGSGQVNRLRWGYPRDDGNIEPTPDPDASHSSRNPTHRDPPYGQEPPEVDESVMGLPVTEGEF